MNKTFNFEWNKMLTWDLYWWAKIARKSLFVFKMTGHFTILDKYIFILVAKYLYEIRHNAILKTCTLADYVF